jgi:hypothetical protein
VQAWREGHDEEDADPMQGDDSPAALRLHAERHGTCARACGRATKYHGKGMLHDLPRGDADLRRT